MAWSMRGWAKRELPTEVCSLTARTPRVERRAGPVRQPEWRRKTEEQGTGAREQGSGEEQGTGAREQGSGECS